MAANTQLSTAMARGGLTVVVLSLLVVQACGSKGTAPQPAEKSLRPPIPRSVPVATPPIAVKLPVPLDALAKLSRESSFEESGLRRNATDFSLQLPSNRVVLSNDLAVLSPAFDAGDTGLAGAAFAAYAFAASDYDREPELYLTWASAPPASDLYLALANFQSGRWDWFRPADASLLNFAEVAPYLATDGSLLALVLLAGETPASLDRLSLGQPRPQANLQVSRTSGTAPQMVTLDASASTTSEGTLDLFEWDFEGDGIYDLDSGAAASVQHSFEAGDFTPQVRVTNSAGHSALASAGSISVQDEWRHSLGQGGYYYGFTSMVADAEGNIYAAGFRIMYLIEFDPIELVAKWNRDGDLLWARYGSPYRGYSGIALDSESNLVLSGSSGGVGLLQKWNPDGELVWARYVQQTGKQVHFSAIAVQGTDIFVCGDYMDNAQQDLDALVMRFNADGSQAWIQVYDWFADKAVGLQLGQRQGGLDTLFVLADVFKESAPAAVFPMYYMFDLDGTFLKDGRISDSGVAIHPGGLAVDYDAGSGTSQIWMACEGGESSQSDLLIFGLQTLGAELGTTSLFQHYWDGAGASKPKVLRRSGELLLIGGTSSDWASIWTAQSSDGAVTAAEAFVPTTGNSLVNDLLLLDGRLLHCGQTYTHTGSWQALAEAQGTASFTWGPGAGLVGPESMAIAVDATSFQDDVNVMLDNEAVSVQGQLAYRKLPVAP